MDDEQAPQPSPLLEKVWAVAGLLAGAALIFMAIDLLRPVRTEAPSDDS